MGNSTKVRVSVKVRVHFVTPIHLRIEYVPASNHQNTSGLTIAPVIKLRMTSPSHSGVTFLMISLVQTITKRYQNPNSKIVRTKHTKIAGITISFFNQGCKILPNGRVSVKARIERVPASPHWNRSGLTVASVMKSRITLPLDSGVMFFDHKLDAEDKEKEIRKPYSRMMRKYKTPPLVITPPLQLSINQLFSNRICSVWFARPINCLLHATRRQCLSMDGDPDLCMYSSILSVVDVVMG